MAGNGHRPNLIMSGALVSVIGAMNQRGLVYSTAFPTVENPLSESGKWNTGLAVGLKWCDPKVTANGCCASTTPTPNRYDDNIATLSTSVHTFAANQYAQGTFYVASGYTGGSGKHECELFLRASISANSATGYEVSIGMDNEDAGVSVYAFVTKWNGAEGSFTTLLDPSFGVGSYTNTPSFPTNGGAWRAEIVGTTIKAYLNGVQILQVTDSSFSSGQPGLGFWPVDTGVVIGDFGWRNWQAGEL